MIVSLQVGNIHPLPHQNPHESFAGRVNYYYAEKIVSTMHITVMLPLEGDENGVVAKIND